MKVVIDELHAGAFIAARHLTGHAKIFVLRAFGERLAELEAGSELAVCRHCQRSFLFNPALYRAAPRTCFACRVQRTEARSSGCPLRAALTIQFHPGGAYTEVAIAGWCRLERLRHLRPGENLSPGGQGSFTADPGCSPAPSARRNLWERPA